MAKQRGSKGPAEGSRAWEKQLCKNPVYVRNTIDDLARRASRGDEGAARTLAAWLERHPEVGQTVRALDDLRTRAEAAWVRAVAGSDLVLERAIRDEVAKMTTELLGEAPSVLDRVMVSHWVVAHLANEAALMSTAQAADSPAVAAARDRRAESTARRLLLATKALVLVRGQKGRGLAPPPNIKLFQATA